MRIRGAAGWAALFLLSAVVPASAQSTDPPIQGVTTVVPELTMAGTISQLLAPIGGPHVGDAFGLAVKLEVATSPFGASSGGFMIKLDPKTGLQVRTATTFGPSFAERALTSGEGNVSVGVNVMSATYDRLGSSGFNGLQLRSVTADAPTNGRSGIANISLTSRTAVIAARIGVTDNFDIGVTVPLVTIKAIGTTTLRNGNGDIMVFAKGSDVAKGIGDVAGIAKYRFYSFGTDLPDPGGLAVMATVRLPTGDKDNLRGLGVTRTLVSFIASSGAGKFRPHANVGFEWWSKGVGGQSDYVAGGSVGARHQYEFAAGLELEAAPKVTLIVDLLGRNIMGGGKIGFQPDASVGAGISATRSAVALPEGIRKLDLAPGMKVNLKGKMLLSLNALIALSDKGLHARVTPMAGVDLTF